MAMLKGSKSQAERVKFNMIKLGLRNPGRLVSRAKAQYIDSSMGSSHIAVGITQTQNENMT